MKRTILATMAALLMSTAAQAENDITLYSSKDSQWSVSQMARNSNGDAMCTMQTLFAKGAIWLKMSAHGSLQFHVGKGTWSFVKGNKRVPLTVSFDDREDWPAKAEILGKDLLYLTLTPEQMPRFLDQVRTSDKMVVHFPKGNEPDWIAGMKGSRKAVEVFWKCASDIGALDALNAQPGEEDDEKPAADKRGA